MDSAAHSGIHYALKISSRDPLRSSRDQCSNGLSSCQLQLTQPFSVSVVFCPGGRWPNGRRELRAEL